MKKLLTTTTIMLTLLLLTTTTALSQGSDVRLQQIENKIATKTGQVATASDKVKNKSISFIKATVVANSTGVLTVANDDGVKTIYSNDSTKFINFDSSGKKLIGIGDIKINDTIQIVGLAQKNQTGVAKLIIRDQRKLASSFSFLGKIAEIKDNTVSLFHFNRVDLAKIVITLEQNVVISTTKNKALARNALIANQSVLVAGSIDEKGSFSTKTLFLIKQTPKFATGSSN